MSPLKADLICEIIRKSQCNFLEKKGFHPGPPCDEEEMKVLRWVQMNAKEYREHFRDCLESYSTTDLGDILKEVSQSGKDLNDVLIKAPAFVERA